MRPIFGLSVDRQILILLLLAVALMGLCLVLLFQYVRTPPPHSVCPCGYITPMPTFGTQVSTP
jgi:hypothetical protein